MKQWFCRLAVCSLLLIASGVSGLGCASSGSSNLWMYPHKDQGNFALSGDDHRHAIARILEVDRRGLIEDLDYFFLTDRPSRLTRWHSR